MYFLTCAAVDFYALALPIAAGKDGVQASALHGKMKQSQREATLATFTAKPGGADVQHAKSVTKYIRNWDLWQENKVFECVIFMLLWHSLAAQSFLLQVCSNGGRQCSNRM